VIYTGHYETRYRTETYSYQVQVDQTPEYARDESGNILYSTSYVQQAQQVWVAGTLPAPTLTVTTPASTPGYLVAAVPTQYSASVTTAAGSTAISTTIPGTFSQSAGLNTDNQWLRPLVLQKTDRWGNVLEITDPRSVYWKTTYRYNASNQLVEQRQPDVNGGQSVTSPITSLYYDRLGRQVATRDANGFVSGQVFDARCGPPALKAA
jgi:YD repeat-containing protein